jgi:WD40 repeat protein
MVNDPESLDPVPPLLPALRLDPLFRQATPPVEQAGLAANTPAVPAPPADIPGYEILEEIARSGTAVVYRARDIVQQRIVALKVFLSAANAGAKDLERFRIEAEVLARFQHPNIVQIYEVGAWQGLPYLAVEFCAGGTLSSTLGGRRLDPRQAAALVRTLAQALLLAHANNVIHCDLKPANILLQMADSKSPIEHQGQEQSAICNLQPAIPKITGFGLATILDESRLAAIGAIVGTPKYMAPEQVRGDGQQVGPATDIYALGVLLYELLTGRPPFSAASAVDTLMQVVAQEPTPPRQPFPHIPRDLELICLKCLQKDPGQRYPSAAFLAEDLRRFLGGEKIMVQPPSWLEPVRRWFERHPYRWITGFLVVVIVALLFVIRDLAVDADRWAQQSKSIQTMKQAFSALGDAGLRVKITKTEQQLARAEDRLRSAHLMRVDALASSDPWQALQILRDPIVFPAGQRDPAWHFYEDLCMRASALVLDARDTGVPCVAFSHNGKLLASGSQTGFVSLWDPLTHQRRDLLPAHTKRVIVLAWNHLDTRLASAGDDGVIALWEVAAEKRLTILEGHKGRVAGLAWHPDGKTLASAGADGTIRLWDTEHRKQQDSWTAGTNLLAMAWSSDGMTLATAGDDNAIELWVPMTRQLRMVLRGHTDVLHDLAFSRDGKTLASASGDGTVRVWDATLGKLQAVLPSHSGGALAVAWHPNGGLLASTAGDNTVRLWNTATNREHAVLRGLPEPATFLSWDRDGATLAVSSFKSPLIHLWRPAPAADRFTLAWPPLWPMALGDDGRLLAVADDHQTTRVFDSKTGKTIALLRDSPLTAASPDGRWNSALQTGTLLLKDVANNLPPVKLAGRVSEVTAQLWSADSQTLATAGVDGTIHLWHVATGEQRAVLRGHSQRVTGLAWSAGGRFLVSRSSDGTIKLWQVSTLKE